MLELESFVYEHRQRFSFQDSHVFACSFAKVTRRWRFLRVIHGRYGEACRAFIANSEAFRRSVTPGAVCVLTEEQVTLQREGAFIGTLVHLEIETFYLFAKILLDEVAHAIANYFGPARGLGITSHDKLEKKIDAYAADRGLCVAQEMRAALADLKKRIADFRDKQIAHEQNPRTVRGGLMWGPDGQVSSVSSQIFPKPGEEQVNSESLDSLMEALGAYLRIVIDFIEINKAKARFKTDGDQVVPEKV